MRLPVEVEPLRFLAGTCPSRRWWARTVSAKGVASEDPSGLEQKLFLPHASFDAPSTRTPGFEAEVAPN